MQGMQFYHDMQISLYLIPALLQSDRPIPN